MDPNDIKKLRKLTSFEALVDYLCDELDWPIEAEDAEKVAFEYNPKELGIDPLHAVKIESIKQIRPLSDKQPWGVFYIQFENKNLPVVVLRRILHALVPASRKRDPNRKAWKMSDLLFISSQGAANDRSISFAHFQEVDGKPQLRTFAWDVKETHLYYIKNLNLNALRWPVDARDADAWRRQWNEAFTVAHREVPRTAEMLAKKMAQIASYIREAVELTYSMEHTGGPLHQLHHNLKLDLISDLSEDDFSDMYAQTVTYGLFAARATRSGCFTSTDTTALIEHTNPFLRELLEQMMNQQSIDLDELGVTELTELLGKVKMEAILQDFGRQKRGEDPVIHFYETFMREYDPQQKTKRGEFYTPDPAVSFIVRSVDHLLRTEFDCPDGLLSKASTDGSFSPVFLDPATGTGTFLRYIVMVAWDTFFQKYKKLSNAQRKEKWNQYVRESLLPRLYAFELKMSPYTIAHMKVGLTLQEFGFEFREGERLQIYLSNALQPAHEVARVDTPALAHEMEHANKVKNKAPVTVIVGNPPYANFGMMNKGEWISELLDDYKAGLDERKLNLDDDFIKFIRFAQWRIDKTGAGILAFITNNTFIDGITHRRMRESLMNSFDRIYILNLHGSAMKGENPPAGQEDENVFEIQQGVSINLFIKRPKKTSGSKVFYADLWGTQKQKYESLLLTNISNPELVEIKAEKPYFFFAPKDFSLQSEYDKGWKISEIFENSISGVQTKKDGLFADYDVDTLQEKIKHLLDPKITRKKKSSSFDLSESDGWILDKASKITFTKSKIRPLLMSPMDYRYVYYEPSLLGRARYQVMQHMLKPNLGFVFMRQSTGDNEYDQISVVRELVTDRFLFSNHGAPFLAPLYIYNTSENSLQSSFLNEPKDNRKPNFSNEFLQSVSDGFKLRLDQDGIGDLRKTFGPEDVFHYMYAIFHSPAYRSRYGEFLKIDFPRLPLTSNVELFRQLCELGKELVALHLLEASVLNKPLTKFKGTGDNVVAKGYPKYQDGVVLVNATQGFEGVPEDVWEFHIGGYQVCQKWLKDRRGRELSAEDIVHYQKIVVALKETIRLMKEVDAVIDVHGGWPMK